MTYSNARLVEHGAKLGYGMQRKRASLVAADAVLAGQHRTFKTEGEALAFGEAFACNVVIEEERLKLAASIEGYSKAEVFDILKAGYAKLDVSDQDLIRAFLTNDPNALPAASRALSIRVLALHYIEALLHAFRMGIDRT